MTRKAAVTLAGAALLLALGRAPAAHAATINVDGVNCTLIEAIQTANSDLPVPGCTTGNGADTINLQTDITLTTAYSLYYEIDTALPLITSTITIEGNGHTIERDSSSDKFRLMAVSSSGDLTLNNVTLTGGYAYRLETVPAPYNPPDYVYKSYYGDGGAIYSNGNLTITNSEISGNKARYDGGAIYSGGGMNTITNSQISDNVAYDDGGALYSVEGVITISNSEISGNTAARGGAIYQDETTITIINSTLSNNIATYGGGGTIYNDDGDLTIRNSTISGNKSFEDDGGAIYNDFGTTTISQTALYDNNAYEFTGGGLFNFDGEVYIDDSTIRNNSARYGGGLYSNDGLIKITNSTITDNHVVNSYGYGGYGGGIYIDEGDMEITNSTISGNSAGQSGGGLFNDEGEVFITNSTITDNTADESGGGVYQELGDANVTFIRSLVSGNEATAGSEIYMRVNNTGFGNNRNVFGHAGLTDGAAFVNFTPGGTDTKATSNGTNVLLENILETSLEDNGGPTVGRSSLGEPMLTHALVEGSPAIDKAPSINCTATPTDGEDQRGYARNVDGNGAASTIECDAGAFEYGSSPVVGDAGLYMTAAGPGMTGDGLAFGKEDILSWDGSAWSLFFDGSAAGLKTGNKGHDINAIHVNSADDLYISFFQNKIKTTNLGQVFGTDVLHYNGSELEYFFDGSDVGLDKVAQEKIDGFHILDGSLSPVGGSCDAYLLISTFGTGQVPAAGGGMLKFNGEDILGFCLTNPGLDTQGFWHMAVDGSAQGMPKNSTDSISAQANGLADDGEIIYLTTRGAFNVDSASGSHSQVYRYDTTTGTFSGPFFSAADNGLDEQVDGLHLVGDLP